MVDSVYRTRSLGVAAEGIPDQYADGNAARLWEVYIGGRQERTSQYKEWLVDQLRARNCHTILDAACGTGVDSIMLVEEGFRVMSTDASDKMLKYALKERWNRRDQPGFNEWLIEEGNWLTLVDDVSTAYVEHSPINGDVINQNGGDDVKKSSHHPQFDAVLCLGNSFAHLPDFDGDLSRQRTAIGNFMELVRPGGFLLIDHRNYDQILSSGAVPTNNIYYNSSHIDRIKCSNLYINGKANMVTMDYYMNASSLANIFGAEFTKNLAAHHFRLSYYPHQLEEFNGLIRQVAGPNAKHTVYADFKPLGEIDVPAYYVHVVEKPKH
jgi:glycine N-methyltransferase